MGGLSRRGADMARILVAEDDRAIRHILTVALQSEGHDVREASNGQEALELLPTFAPDLVLLDLGMPVLDGYSFLEWMPAEDPPYVLVVYAILPEAPEIAD